MLINLIKLALAHIPVVTFKSDFKSSQVQIKLSVIWSFSAVENVTFELQVHDLYHICILMLVVMADFFSKWYTIIDIPGIHPFQMWLWLRFCNN